MSACVDGSRLLHRCSRRSLLEGRILRLHRQSTSSCIKTTPQPSPRNDCSDSSGFNNRCHSSRAVQMRPCSAGSSIRKDSISMPPGVWANQSQTCGGWNLPATRSRNSRYTYTYAYTYTYTYDMHMHMHIYIDVHIHLDLGIYVYRYMFVDLCCMCLYMYTCIYVSMCRCTDA